MTYEITYAYEEDGTTPQDAPWAHNILGVFEKKAGVCEAYARTYELLLNYLNIDNILVTGKSHGENHAWNLVGVDGVYYWSDCTWGAEDGSTTRFYNLKGNNNWADHTPDTMDIASGQVLYDLPENISDEDCTFKQIKVYENDQYIGMVNDIDDAFALMTNESSSYKLILNNRGQYLVYTSEWPAVNSIEIKASRYILKGSGFVCPDIQLVTEVTVNSDMVLSCVNVVTETNYYLYQNNNYCAEINIQNNTITTLEDVNFGGKLIEVYDTEGTYEAINRVGVNLTGGEESKIIDSSTGFMLFESNKVDINTMEVPFLSIRVDGFNVSNLKAVGRIDFKTDTKIQINNLTAGNIVVDCNECTDSNIVIDNLIYCDKNSDYIPIDLYESSETNYPDITIKSFDKCLVFNINGQWTDFDGYTSAIAHITGANENNVTVNYNGTDRTGEFTFNEAGDVIKCAHLSEAIHVAASDATCTQAGNKEYYKCPDCNTIFTSASKDEKVSFSEVIIPAEHTGLNRYLTAKQSSCTEEGNTDVYFCADCGGYFSDAEGKNKIDEGSWVIPRHSGHLQHIEATPSSCADEGNTDVYYCDVCGGHFSDSEGKNKMEEGAWIIPCHTGLPKYLDAKAPTCVNEGNIDVYFCADCYSYFSDSEGKNKIIDSWVIPATMKHIIVNGVCKQCGGNFRIDAPGIVISRVNGKAKLTWAKVSNAAKYEIYRSSSVNGTYSKLATVTGLTYTDSRASSGVTYYYKVKAIAGVKGYVDSNFGATVKFTTSPGATTISSVANNSTGIKITWKKNNSATGYKIQRRTNGGAWKTIKAINGKSTVSYVDTKATTNGAKYQYRVYVNKNVGGETYTSAASGEKTIYRLSRPKISKLTAGAKAFTLKYSANTKCTGYQLQYSTKSNFASGVKTVTISGARTASKKIARLVAKKKYYVRVRSYKTVSKVKYYSAWSTAKSVTTKK